MSDLIFAPETKIGKVTYTTKVTEADNKGKKEKCIFINAEHEDGRTQTVTIFAGGGAVKNKFDYQDKVVVDRKGDAFKVNTGYMNNIFSKIAGNEIDELEENTIEDPSAKATSTGFSLSNDGAKITRVWELLNNSKYKDKNRPKFLGEVPLAKPEGYTENGAEWKSDDKTITTKKPESKRAREYKTKLAEIQAQKNAAQTRLNQLLARYGQVVQDANTHGYWCEGYNAAGNGTAIEMHEKYVKEINRLNGVLETFENSISALNEEYKDVADEVKSTTTVIPGTTYQPQGTGTKKTDKTKEDDAVDNDNDNEDEEEETDTSLSQKPESLEKAKKQTDKIIEETKDMIDHLDEESELLEPARTVNNKAKELKEKLDKDEITIENAQRELEKIKEEYEKAKKGNQERKIDNSQTIDEN